MLHVRPFDLDAVENTVNEDDTDIAIVLTKHNQNSDGERGDDDNYGTFTMKDMGSECRSASQSLQYFGKITYNFTSVT